MKPQKPSVSQPVSLEDLDSNFQIQTVDADNELKWLDARQLTLEGQGWPQESDVYCRFPDRAQAIVRPPVWDLSRHSAGICVRFTCDAPCIWARWKLRSPQLAMPHMTAAGVSGLDLYARNGNSGGKWLWAGLGKPLATENESVLLENIVPGETEYCLFLPLYNGLLSLEIGVPRSVTIAPSYRHEEKPLCFYGTSIVQGGCAARPGMAYPAIIGRALDRSCLNLGFSGNAKSEREVANLLAELEPSVYVLDPLPNMTAEEVSERIGPLVQTLRRQHPATPVVMVENIEYQNSWINTAGRDKTAGTNQSLRVIYNELSSAGIPNLHYVPLHDLLGHDRESTVDGVHPTDLGFLRIANVLEPVIKRLLD